jgi:hypothetical protein
VSKHLEDDINLEIWQHSSTGDFFVVDPSRHLALGPLESDQALRRFRVSREWVSDGCDAGTWNYDFNLSSPGALGFPQEHYIVLEQTGWVPPSRTQWTWSGEEKVPIRCCPTVWGSANPTFSMLKRPPDWVSEFQFPIPVEDLWFGRLKTTWKHHPAGSVIASGSTMPGCPFWILENSCSV